MLRHLELERVVNRIGYASVRRSCLYGRPPALWIKAYRAVAHLQCFRQGHAGHTVFSFDLSGHRSG